MEISDRPACLSADGHALAVAAGQAGPTPVAPSLAVDGIGELPAGFHARANSRVRSGSPRTLLVNTGNAANAGNAGNTETAWTVRLSADPPRTQHGGDAAEPADCTLSGTAGALYPALRYRAPLSPVEATGDVGVAPLRAENSAVIR
ncbi:hypothetical protein ACFYY2_29200 [Streptomyces sp. NPDC001822]|uniref:hypothetical protein n=1 Tax=Streptomyces sp. NPDC001822 TaxID=3364614 RepID=UPI0036B92E69